jgi:hypothetical protein
VLTQAIEQIGQIFERQLSEQVGVPASPQQLSEQQRATLRLLERFAASKGVRHFPTSPALLAAFLDSQGDADPFPIIDAVVQAHDTLGLANPACTSAVKLALSRSPCKDYPRSWSSEDRVVFASLDPLTRAVVLRRENERDVALRRKQTQLDQQLKAAKAALPKENDIDTQTK